MNVQAAYAENSKAINVQQAGFTLFRRGELFLLRIEDEAGRHEKIVDPSHREDLQGEIILPNARLNYWFDETRAEWHFIYLYESNTPGEFATKWGSQHIRIDSEGIQEIEAGESPDKPGSMLRILNIETISILVAAIAAWIYFAYMR